jgi:hypothetical protein
MPILKSGSGGPSRRRRRRPGGGSTIGGARALTARHQAERHHHRAQQDRIRQRRRCRVEALAVRIEGVERIEETFVVRVLLQLGRHRLEQLVFGQGQERLLGAA